MNHDRPDEPLPYRNAADDRPAARSAMVRAVGGVLSSTFGVAVIGFFVFLATMSFPAPAGRHGWAQAGAFGTVALGAGVGLAYAWPHRRGREFAVGCLIGLIVACLIEGKCFF